MKTAVIMILLVAVFVFSWVAEDKLRKKLFTELLRFKKIGDEKMYFNLLQSPVSAFSLSKKSRTLLGLDYYLAYSENKNIYNVVIKLTKKATNLDKDRDLLIRLMRCYIFFLEENQQEDSGNLAIYLTDNCHLKEVHKEVKELYQVYLAPNKKLLMDLDNQLKSAHEPQQQLIIYQRLVKVTELLGLKKEANAYLKEMRKIAQNTVKMEEF